MLTYQLDKGAPQPLYVQLYRGIRLDIEAGAIASGEKLPSKRALAAHLGISVITVEAAYGQLEAEGYIEARPRCGFFTCDVGPSVAPALRQTTSFATELHPGSQLMRPSSALPEKEAGGRGNGAPREGRNSAPSPVKPMSEMFADFTGATSPTGIFPYDAWARTMRQVLAEQDETRLLFSSDGRGTYQLRSAIANHLRGFRGMEVSPDQVIIGSGAQSLYGLLVQLLGRQRTFAIENPGYSRLARIYQSHGVPLRLVGLDEKGPLVSQLEESGASVFHCMPSHQFPLGTTTTVGRRQELLEWAAGGGNLRYLIEDDYDCEFRMAGQPIPPLQAMDGRECVIYTNTFTKTLGAAFRIGYMVLPPRLARQYQEQLGFYACTVGALEQLTLARFIESGQYERHVNRQRTHFRKVQNALVKALSEQQRQAKGAWALQLRNVGAGLHFVMEVEARDSRGSDAGGGGDRDCNAGGCGIEARDIAARALSGGVDLSPLSDYWLDGAPQQGAAFVMNFSALNEEDAPKAAVVIANAIADGCR